MMKKIAALGNNNNKNLYYVFSLSQLYWVFAAFVN